MDVSYSLEDSSEFTKGLSTDEISRLNQRQTLPSPSERMRLFSFHKRHLRLPFSRHKGKKGEKERLSSPDKDRSNSSTPTKHRKLSSSSFRSPGSKRNPGESRWTTHYKYCCPLDFISAYVSSFTWWPVDNFVVLLASLCIKCLSFELYLIDFELVPVIQSHFKQLLQDAHKTARIGPSLLLLNLLKVWKVQYYVDNLRSFVIMWDGPFHNKIILFVSYLQMSYWLITSDRQQGPGLVSILVRCVTKGSQGSWNMLSNVLVSKRLSLVFLSLQDYSLLFTSLNYVDLGKTNRKWIVRYLCDQMSNKKRTHNYTNIPHTYVHTKIILVII